MRPLWSAGPGTRRTASPCSRSEWPSRRRTCRTCWCSPSCWTSLEQGGQMVRAKFLDCRHLAIRAWGTMAPLCYVTKLDPFLSLDCASNPPARRIQGKEWIQFCHLATLPGKDRIEGGALLADALHWFILWVDSCLIPSGLRPVDKIPFRIVPVYQGSWLYCSNGCHMYVYLGIYLSRHI